MKCSHMQLAVAIVLLTFGLTQAAGVSAGQSIGIQSTPEIVTDLTMPDGYIDLTVSGTGDNQLPLKLDGVDVRINPATGAPILGQSPTVYSSPDDIYWDNSISSALGETDSTVTALAIYNGKLIAGGNFTVIGGAAANHIACWNGTSWSPLQAGLDRSVASMMIDDNKLVVGGYFTMAGDAPAGHIAAWDGGNWMPLGVGIPHPVVSMVNYNDALTVVDLYEDHNWDPGPMIYVSLLSWDGSDWTEFAGKSGGQMRIGDLITFGDNLLMPRNYPGSIEGGFATAYIDSWDGSSWSTIFNGLGSIGGSTVLEGRLLVGKAGWYTGGYIVDSWDGTAWTDMGWSIRGLAKVFTSFDKKLIIGGDFDSVGGISARNIAAWDGETWSALGSGTNGPVDRLATYKGNLIAAGNFTTAGDKISPFIAVWTKRQIKPVSLDVKPGSCPNPINGNGAHGQGKAVLPVAVMGTADFDVHDIDPTTITLNGALSLRASKLFAWITDQNAELNPITRNAISTTTVTRVSSLFTPGAPRSAPTAARRSRNTSAANCPRSSQTGA